MTQQASRAPHLRVSRWLVVALVVVLVVAGVVAWRLHGRGSVSVGDRFDGAGVSRTTRSGTVEKPDEQTVPLAFGSLSVTLDTGDEVDEGDRRVHAPSGSSMVEVTWSPATTFQSSPVWEGASAGERQDPGAELMLVAGGHRYSIAKGVAAADEGSSTVIVVHGDGSDARVESRFSGRTFPPAFGTQTSPAMRSDGYNGCEDATDKTFSRVTCRLPVYRSVYVAGLGAAPADKEWLVVSGGSAVREQKAIRVYNKDESQAEYQPSGKPKVSVTVDGVTAKPKIAGADKVTGDSVQVADRAWLVESGRTYVVRLRYRLPAKLDRAGSDWTGAPATREVDVSTKVVYPAI